MMAVDLLADLGVVEDRLRLIGVGVGTEHDPLHPPSARRQAERHTGDQQENTGQAALHRRVSRIDALPCE